MDGFGLLNGYMENIEQTSVSRFVINLRRYMNDIEKLGYLAISSNVELRLLNRGIKKIEEPSTTMFIICEN